MLALSTVSVCNPSPSCFVGRLNTLKNNMIKVPFSVPGVGDAPLLHVPAGHGGPRAGAAVEGEGHGCSGLGAWMVSIGALR